MKKVCATGLVRKTLATILFIPALALAEIPSPNFHSAEQSLREQQEALYRLAEEHGRYAPMLLEPLQRLARSQVEVNRYEAAADTVDYAVQIARSAEGLNTPKQYDLQQLAVEIDLYRQDWPAINDRLAYYSRLILANFEGSADERLARLQWLANMHVRGGIEDSKERHAHHLIHATWYAETAVLYAQSIGQDKSRQYAELLYDLAEKYYLEARAILAGGSTGYHLRQIKPGHHLLDEKGEAFDKRYRAGLDKLVMVRELFARSALFGEEAVGMAQLHIADWKAAFNKTEDLNAEYGRAIALLNHAGVPGNRLQQLLSHPTVIPRATLELSVHEALSFAHNNLRSDATDDLIHRVSLLEPAPHIAGFVQDLELLDWQGGLVSDWSRLTVSMTIDPYEEKLVRSTAYRVKSRVTGTDIEIHESEADQDLTRQALRRIKTLSFRPAFVDGQAIASQLALDYLVRSSSLRSVTPLVAEISPLSNHGASLAAAGE